ncbi:MAG: TIGR02302 family protein, partial [Pseudomonadota bacterium]
MGDSGLRAREDPRRQWRFHWRLAASRFAHAFEEIWPALWPPLAVLGLFLIISLFGLWRYLPGWLHGIGLVAFVAAFLWTLWQARPAFGWPSRHAGLGRLEDVNDLSHRPLRSLDDELSGGHDDPLTRRLWRRHRERLTSMIGRLKVGLPRSDLPGRDRWALRIALALVLIIALVEAGSMAPTRLAQAFDLKRPDGAAQEAIQLVVWVTPPEYTGLPAEALEPVEAPIEGALIDTTPSVSFPVGSEVLAQLHHVDGVVERFALSLSGQSEPFAGAGGKSAEARMVLESPGELRIGDQHDALGIWQVDVVEDAPPAIAFAADPAVTQRQVMRFAFEATDDYGVTSIALHLSRPGRMEGAERLELVQPAEGATELNDAAYLDLTPHRWSGLPVEVKLEAVDGLEQIGESDVRQFVLPTRNFTHPVARAIVEQRRLLADQPDQREKVAAAMNGLSHVPERFQNDATVFMALRSMATRLMFGEDEASIDEVLELMWETALHLEDGSLSLAGRELRELQEALKEALANDASDEELARLMDELRQALDNYLDALAQQMQQMADQPMQPMDQNAMSIERQDLQQMLDSMQDMIETGAREAAQQMLAQMQELLENLQVGQQNSQMQQGQQMLDQLQQMIQRQQELLDDTFGLSREQGQQGQMDRPGQEGQQGQQQSQQGQQGQQGQMGQQPGMRPGQGGQQMQSGLAAGQEALRRQLGELMRSLGENGVPIPRAMGEAELSMRDARDALQGGQPGQALDPQTNALD